MAKTHVYSTLSASMIYSAYVSGGGDLPATRDGIMIRGGANIPDKYMRTPEGAVINEVTDAELARLREDLVFQMHEKNGFMTVVQGKRDPEVVAADMETRDQSAPLVDSDFAEGQAPVAAVGAVDDAPPAAKANKRKA